MFRKKKRCRNLSPSPHPSYNGKRCRREEGHDGMCQLKIGPYRHYWNQAVYERRGQARVVDD
jgi:hypothetical protein